MSTSAKEKVYDLHCDLLLYLMEEKRTAFDRQARCSFPQLQEGGVALQTFALYTQTEPGSHAKARKQWEILQNLKTPCEKLAAIENASGVLGEEEKFELFYDRFQAFGPLLYISLTWNHENRFGGGNASTVGLKEDGRRVLDYLDGKKVAIDLSHTSDRLAFDILDYIDKRGLKIIPCASHSNFRVIKDVARNLPDELALEIIRRGGVIGLNFVRAFIGDDFVSSFLKMVEHGLHLNAGQNLCFGADFFYEGDSLNLGHLHPMFVEEYGNASCYPRLLPQLKGVEGIAHDNCRRFIERVKA